LVTTHLTAAGVSAGAWVLIGWGWAWALQFAFAIDGLAFRYLDQIAALFVSGVVLFLLAVVFNYLLITLEASRKAESKALELQVLAREAELKTLRAQIDPHFLFNSLNTLSGLIHEDQHKGEKFLDEMSKVYRYMLHNDEETLVKLDTELKFLESYIHILEVRHSDGLKVSIHVTEEDKNKWLPPLTLQTIIENSVAQYSVCRDCPLEIVISSEDDGFISIRNNVVQRRMSDQPQENAPDLGNIVKKYKLLNQPDVKIEEEETKRRITIPLIAKNEEELV